MKKIILIAALLITGLSFQTKAQDYYDRGYDDSYNYQGYDNDGFRYFYASLSPYGTWIEFGDGVYGWRPVHMRHGWAPYANGRWIWTSDGWYWDSYEPFGYIVFHYGRWYYDDYYGWVWIPDYQWAPAWVEWRYDDAYIGWAPLPPYAIFSISVGIHFTHTYYTPYSYWHFVKYHYFCDPYVGKYYVGPKYVNRIYSRTKYRNDYGYRDGRVINRGIDVNMIRERGKVDIRERKIRTVSGLRDINDKNRVTNDEIRTFIPDKKNFSGANVRDVKIDRTNRKTSLETSKVEFGRVKTDRKQVPELRNDAGKNGKDVRIQNNAPKENVRKNNRTDGKGKVEDTRIKPNQRKDRKEPVYNSPVNKESRPTTQTRIESGNRPETKVNERTIRKNNETRKEMRTVTPQIQKRNSTEVNKTQKENRGSGSNTTISKQNDSRTKTEVKRESTNRRGRR